MSVSPDKVVPIGPWVLIKVLPKEEKSNGIIIRPSTAFSEKTGHAVGKVLKAGQGITVTNPDGSTVTKPLSIKEGDTVLFREYLKDVQPLGVDEPGVSLLHYKDIIGKVIGNADSD